MNTLTAAIATTAATVAIGLFMFWGETARKHNAEHDAIHVYHLKSLVAPVEMLKAEFEGTRASVVVQESGGKAPHAEFRWSLLETKEWLFMSARALGKSCPLLEDFAQVNGPETEIAPENLDVISLALKGKTSTVRGYVPRFTAKPQGLSACAGYTYDVDAGILRIGGKAVALLAAEQPDWAH